MTTTLLIVLSFLVITVPISDDRAEGCVTVFIRNNLDLQAYIWLDADSAGSIRPTNTQVLRFDSSLYGKPVQLTLASVCELGNVFLSTLELNVSNGDHVMIWFGAARPPYENDRATAQAIDSAAPPARLMAVLERVRAPGRDGGGAEDQGANESLTESGVVVSRVVAGTTHPNRKIITNSIGMRLVEILPGEFLQGCTADEPGCTSPERQHRVRITKGFFIGETEVTQAQWNAVMGTNPSHFKGDDLPVESVTWYDAVEFCRRLSAIEGRRYRLPTEAEWEYACRAGTTTTFSFGNTLDRVDKFAWTNRNADLRTRPVASLLPNAWGLYDMHGNVLEWCFDWWSWRYPHELQFDPRGPDDGREKVARGGRWSYDANWTRSAARDSKRPRDAYNDLGLRVVLELD